MRAAHATVRSARRPALVLLGLIVLAGCGSGPPSAAPTAAAQRPSVQIDQEWTATDDQWTFTGFLDPQGVATDVLLEVGPGPATVRQFDTKVPVEQGVTAAGPLTTTTAEIPDIKEICVRFTATSSVGSSSTSPLCFPHDRPSIAPAAAPTVEIEPAWTFADGAWSFTGRIDPRGASADVVLEIGSGPAPGKTFATKVPAAADLAELATVIVTTKAVPDTDEICVRFTATNRLGTASSAPLCFGHDDRPGASPGPS